MNLTLSTEFLEDLAPRASESGRLFPTLTVLTNGLELSNYNQRERLKVARVRGFVGFAMGKGDDPCDAVQKSYGWLIGLLEIHGSDPGYLQ